MMSEKECKDFFLMYFPDVKKIIFNNPATILFFKNGEKSVVRWNGELSFDLEKAVLYAYTKHKAKSYKKTKNLLQNICNFNIISSQFLRSGISSQSSNQTAQINFSEKIFNKKKVRKLLKNYVKTHQFVNEVLADRAINSSQAGTATRRVMLELADDDIKLKS